MSVIPQEIPELGSSQLAPRQNPEFAPGPGFTTEEYFVWSRLDGRTSFREVILMVGLGIEKSIGILRKLRRSGAFLLPGEDPAALKALLKAQAAAEAAAAAPPPETEKERELPDLGALTPDEERTLSEEVGLQEREKRRIIQMMRLVAGSDYFALLGVGQGADKRELRRAYFRLSKEFHPDRHYKTNLGTFKPLLNIIFETATQAFQVLSDDARRTDYLHSLASGRDGTGRVPRTITAQDMSGPVGKASTPRAQHAVDLYSRACEREVAGDTAGALRMFDAAIRADPQPRYLRRAAKCALNFGQHKLAEVYVEKAIKLRAADASYVRLMAEVQLASGRLDEAEETILRALEMPSTSDNLMRELQSDLAAVRAAKTRRAKG